MLRSIYSWFQIGLASLLIVLPASVSFSQSEQPVGGPDAPIAQLDAETRSLHDKLAKYLSGTKWTGQFTMEGKDGPRTEHYEIITAEKGEIGDYWNLVARIKYGDHDKTFPLPPIEIKFAGGTPVITVDQVFFPGFGTFDARVLIRKGQYAGTWAHVAGEKGGGVGGHMFGTIEKMDPADLQKKTETLKETEKEGESDEPQTSNVDEQG
jgi:hypothetical protein